MRNDVRHSTRSRRGTRVKKCARCGARYDEEYDSCPECADDPYANKPWLNPAGCFWTVVVIIAVIIVLGLLSR